ncbi:MAG: hypothetical protein R3E13_05265 [Alphaproteobacteria bacterium]
MDDHPEACFTFIKRRNSVSAALRDVDKLVQQGECRIIAWMPPGLEDLHDILKRENGQGTFVYNALTPDVRTDFRAGVNLHTDESAGRQSPESISSKRLLNGRVLNLTQSWEGLGTHFYFVSEGYPQRDALYKSLGGDAELSEGSNRFKRYADNIQGPFCLASGLVGFIVPDAFGEQATIHGFSVRYGLGDNRKRQTLIAPIQPTGFR